MSQGCLEAGVCGSYADMILGDAEHDDGEAAEEEEEGSHAGRTEWEEDEKHCTDASRSVIPLERVTVHSCNLRDHQL